MTKKTFLLQGLGCANCAGKIERGVKAMEGVTAATVNFMTAKLIIEAEDAAMEGVIEKAKALIHKLEPHVVVKKA